MMSIDDVETLLDTMREQQAAETRARVEAAAKQREAEEAEKIAADSKRRAAWWAEQKFSRVCCVVPADVHSTHFEFGAPGRQWTDHTGRTVRGSEILQVEIEDGRRVVYLRSLADFRLLINNDRNGLLWERANPALLARLAEISPKNYGTIPEAPQPPR